MDQTIQKCAREECLAAVVFDAGGRPRYSWGNEHYCSAECIQKEFDEHEANVGEVPGSED